MLSDKDNVPERIAIHPQTVRLRNGYIYPIEDAEPGDIIYARVHSPTGKELTVEAALVELREMFPRDAMKMEFGSGSSAFHCYVRRSGKLIANAPTLAECIAQVRKWKESLNDNSGRDVGSVES